MSKEKHIKQFTATDIEKYHKGLLTASEMHELEKAALEDPFLADALEGYAVAGVQAADDLADLQDRLSEKTGSAKVIPMAAAPRNSFRILRAAVLVAFIAGAGLLIYQFGFNKKEGGIAKTETTQTPPVLSGDSTAAGKISTAPVSESTNSAPETAKPAETTGADKGTVKPLDAETKTATGAGTTVPVTENKDARDVLTNDDIAVKKAEENKPAPPAPAQPTRELNNIAKSSEKPSAQKEGQKEEALDAKKLKNNNQERNVVMSRDETGGQPRRSAEPVTVNTAPGANRDQVQNANIFRGRVTDADNRAVPFANVTNVQDNNTGTYTDANGYFNLTYPDTVLQVQVRSIGYENNNVQLRNAVPNNQVVLQNDRNNLAEVVVTKQQPQSAAAPRKKDGNMKLDEPEPADGWDNYGTYLTNNLDIPPSFKDKPSASGEVVVSFEVDKNGNPVNLRIEKSLCSACDKEALRVVKEGPKWKRTVKKARTRVTVNF